MTFSWGRGRIFWRGTRDENKSRRVGGGIEETEPSVSTRCVAFSRVRANERVK